MAIFNTFSWSTCPKNRKLVLNVPQQLSLLVLRHARLMRSTKHLIYITTSKNQAQKVSLMWPAFSVSWGGCNMQQTAGPLSIAVVHCLARYGFQTKYIYTYDIYKASSIWNTKYRVTCPLFSMYNVKTMNGCLNMWHPKRAMHAACRSMWYRSPLAPSDWTSTIRYTNPSMAIW